MKLLAWIMYVLLVIFTLGLFLEYDRADSDRDTLTKLNATLQENVLEKERELQSVWRRADCYKNAVSDLLIRYVKPDTLYNQDTIAVAECWDDPCIKNEYFEVGIIPLKVPR